MKQFTGESVSVSFCALVLALILIHAFLPEFDALTGKSFNIKMLANGPILFFLFAITLLTGMFAGSYPAFYLSSFRPQYLLNRINYHWRILILSGAFTLLIAIATVSYKSIKAATANPVDSLRHE